MVRILRSATAPALLALGLLAFCATPVRSLQTGPGWKNRLRNVRPSVLVPHLPWNAEEITVGGQ